MGRNSVIDIDHGYKAFMANMKQLAGKPSVKIGFLEGAPPRDPEVHETGELPTNVEIAIWAEFGTKTEPERSFMRSTFDEHKEDYRALVEKLSLAVLHGKMDEQRALGLLGERVTADVRKKILSNIPPPNAPSTLLAKYPKTRTLVESGQLAGGVTWDVEMSK